MEQAIAHLSDDEKLRFVLENFGQPYIQKREEGFAALSHIILEQQVSIASAKACYLKIGEKLGQITPEAILSASDELLRSCGVSRQKMLYLKGLAKMVLDGTLDFSTFSGKTEAQIREELLAVKGVGNWSVEVYLMFCLQSQDIIPLGDIAIRHAIRELYGLQTVEEMASLSESWKPFRTYASYVLWHYYLEKRGRKPV